MKKMILCLFLGLLVVLLVLYILAWGDLSANGMLTERLSENIRMSFSYYFGWLPNWWLVILIGTVVLGLLFYGIGIGIEKLKAQPFSYT